MSRADEDTIMRGRSRSKNGVASLAYDPRIHHIRKTMDCRGKPGNDKESVSAGS
jgi:hypothetical protein